MRVVSKNKIKLLIKHSAANLQSRHLEPEEGESIDTVGWKDEWQLSNSKWEEAGCVGPGHRIACLGI